MFLGHFAVGMASKRWAPRLPLGLLLLGPMFLDLIWPIFLALGIESVRIDPGNTTVTPLDLHDYPYSHSLVSAIAWSVVVGAVIAAVTRQRAAWVVLGVGVFSHWVLDFIAHRPDMPLYPGSSTYVGLGLWNSYPATVLVEAVLFLTGLAIYIHRNRTAASRKRFWFFAATLVSIYVGNLLGPPPPSTNAVIVSAFLLWLFVPWANWVDRPETDPFPTSEQVTTGIGDMRA